MGEGRAGALEEEGKEVGKPSQADWRCKKNVRGLFSGRGGEPTFRLPCPPGRRVVHTRCALEVLARAETPNPLCSPESGCGTKNERRMVLEKFRSVDPASRERGAVLGRKLAGNHPEARPGKNFSWHQNSLGSRKGKRAQHVLG